MLRRLNSWVMDRKPFSRTFWVLFFFIVACLLFVLFQGGKLALMLLIVVSVLCLYISLGKWSGISSVQIQRELLNQLPSGDFEAGVSLKVKLKAQVPGFWPIPYVIIKDQLRHRHGQPLIFETTFVPDWKRRGEVQYETPALRRGFYRFDETICSTEDIFGLFEHQGRLLLQQSFRVLPQTIEILEWDRFNYMLRGAHQHTALTRSPRETTQINGVREYVYGDRISKIHWKSTARTGTWKSKEFERESHPKAIIVLDCHAANYESKDQFEMAVSVAASLLRYALKKNLSIGLLSVGKEATFIEAKRGIDHHKMMMNHLIEVEADGKHTIAEVLRQHMYGFGQGYFVPIISPQLDTSIVMSALEQLKQELIMPCYMNIVDHQHTGDRTDAEEMLRSLQAGGFYGYRIASLQELPNALRGDRVW